MLLDDVTPMMSGAGEWADLGNVSRQRVEGGFKRQEDFVVKPFLAGEEKMGKYKCIGHCTWQFTV